MASERRFEIQATAQYSYWAQLADGQLSINRRSREDQVDDEILLQCNPETLRNLLIWSDEDGSVTYSLTGPLAAQVRQLSEELSLTPEMFVWHAVKVFIETAPGD